ncbi:MAG TPA: hypothetical protein VES20_00865 [Bryobacteraceae bacterium]|nr:hypothetical protein [Bryobacteraceae bacterium]
MGFTVRLEPHLDYEVSLNGGTYRWRREMLVDPTAEYMNRVLQPLAELEPDEFTVGSELDWSVDHWPDEWMGVRDTFRALTVGHKLNHDWALRPRAITYLRSLDYVALSWYVADDRPMPEGYVIGELGLGSSDTSRPWHFDSSTLRTPEALAIRREWYLERLTWLETVRSPRAAAFWTAGQFDVLGVREPEWRDEAVAEAIRRYNQASPQAR